MKEKNKNEKLQSRREFFKNAAKAALPVVGAVVLANLPISVNATEATSCSGTCWGGCQGYCMHTCSGGCKGGCQNSCMQHCTAMQAGY